MRPTMNMRLTLSVRFTREQWEEFCRPISGTGGGQGFVRRLAARRAIPDDAGDVTLVLTGEDVERWFRYRDYRHGGGFEQRLGRGASPQSLFS